MWAYEKMTLLLTQFITSGTSFLMTLWSLKYDVQLQMIKQGIATTACPQISPQLHRLVPNMFVMTNSSCASRWVQAWYNLHLFFKIFFCLHFGKLDPVLLPLPANSVDEQAQSARLYTQHTTDFLFFFCFFSEHQHGTISFTSSTIFASAPQCSLSPGEQFRGYKSRTFWRGWLFCRNHSVFGIQTATLVARVDGVEMRCSV